MNKIKAGKRVWRQARFWINGQVFARFLMRPWVRPKEGKKVLPPAQDWPDGDLKVYLL